MKDVLLLAIHFVTLLVRLLHTSGKMAVAAENLALKKQLLVILRSRLKAPNLTTMDRLIFGWLAMLLSHKRIVQSAIIIDLQPCSRFTKRSSKEST